MQIEQLKTTFTNCSSWQERYKALILLAKQASDYLDSLKDEVHQISGCENKTWLAHIQNEAQSYFIGASDAKMMQGLMIIITTYANRMIEQDCFDTKKIISFLQALNLWNDFSISKQISIEVIVQRMDQLWFQSR